MTAYRYKTEDVSVSWKGKELLPTKAISGLARSMERASDSFVRFNVEVSRFERRKLVGLVQGSWPRRSKGWRKHVRRVKAAERRQR